MNINKRVVVITGASRGIGKSLCDLFLERGDSVISVARSAVHSKLHQGRLFSICADLSDDRGINHCIDEVTQMCRSEDLYIDYLINNAGVVNKHIGVIDRSSSEAIEASFRLMAKAPSLLSMSLAPCFSDSARILNMSTRSAHIGIYGLGTYCIAKHALLGVTRVLRAELKGKALVGHLIPGEVDTDMQADLRNLTEQELPLAKFFNENRKNLIPADVAAKFILWVLETPDSEFETDEEWYIYDTTHHRKWFDLTKKFRYVEP